MYTFERTIVRKKMGQTMAFLSLCVPRTVITKTMHAARGSIPVIRGVAIASQCKIKGRLVHACSLAHTSAMITTLWARGF